VYLKRALDGRPIELNTLFFIEKEMPATPWAAGDR
jgi:hypothetical protein